ncbi:MAG: hypothetical protein ACRDR6_11600 [Pseudonocardiaceae bacterium]
MADRFAGAVALQAGALVVLRWKLQQVDGVGGGGHHPQLVVGVAQQQPGRGHVEELHAAIHQQVQELD